MWMNNRLIRIPCKEVHLKKLIFLNWVFQTIYKLLKVPILIKLIIINQFLTEQIDILMSKIELINQGKF